MKKNLILFVLLISFFSFFSCSIDYSVPGSNESSKPEFMFKDVSFSRVEQGREKAVLYAEDIELYEDENGMYGKGLSFVVYNEDGSVSVAGSCGLFAADTTAEDYVFFDEVNITSYEQDIRVMADNIHWDGKSQQLVSAGASPVRIYSGGFGNSDSSSMNAEITGMGFSADGESLSYQFSEGVSGIIYTEDSGGGQ